MAYMSFILDKQGYMHAFAHTHAPRHTHARTHTSKYVIFIAFHDENNSRTHLSVTLYVHCLSG